MELGITSIVVPEDVLIPTALQIIDREHYTQGYLKRRTEMEGHVRRRKPRSIKQFRASTMEVIHANSAVDPAAPTVVLDHMMKSAKMTAVEACQSESAAFASVWGSEENRGLLHFFFLQERAKKTRPNYQGHPPKHKQRWYRRRRVDGLANCPAVERSWIQFENLRRRRSKNGKTCQRTGGQQIQQGRKRCSIADLNGLAECQLVVECIVEKLKIKKELFQRICSVVDADTFLATNTSTIPVGDIASAVTHPHRLVGLHFCCPVEPLKLVEIIKGDSTSETTLNVAIDLVRQMRKTPVIVGDHPGFVVNRLLCPVFDQAVVLLQHSIGLDRIDRCFREFGFAVGPLEMIDFIGVDTIMYSGETFLRTLPDLISLTPILPALVKRGRLGRKVGCGFYRYDSADAPAEVDEEFLNIIGKYQKESLQLTDEELLGRLLDPMVEQAHQVLNESVVSDAKDVDLCSILGTTFPAVRGGILHWADKETRSVDIGAADQDSITTGSGS